MSNLRIEAYFDQVRRLIDSCLIVQLPNVTYEKRGSYEGYLRGDLIFVDGSILHLREFVDVEIGVERLMYVYHYTDPDRNLIFRYDDTGHHHEVETHPITNTQQAESNLQLHLNFRLSWMRFKD